MSAAPLVGVLLAAGRGRRMGRTKQLLAWPAAAGETTVIAAAFDGLAALADPVVVVLDHDAPEIAAALGPRSFVEIEGRADEEMFDSVRRGLAAALCVAPDSAVALHLADQPRITTLTRTVLDRERRRQPDQVIIPTNGGRGGHPVIIPGARRDQVLAFTDGGGLRAVWRAHPEWCTRCPIDDPWIGIDLDTPEDYAAAYRRAQSDS